MEDIADTGAPTHHEVSPTPLPRIIPFEKYNKEGGIFNLDDHSFVTELLNTDTNERSGKIEDSHIKQALSYGVESGLFLSGTEVEDLPPQVKDTLKIYVLIREAGIKVLNKYQSEERAKAKKVAYQENVPMSNIEASVGEWALGNSDQVVFAEARRLVGGQEAYDQFAKHYPNIFAKQVA